MVWSSHSVVAISINGFYHGRLLHHDSVNDRQLSLVIYVFTSLLIVKVVHIKVA